MHAAREHLAALADAYGLTPEDVADTQARAIHLDRRGASVVALGTAIDGVEVFRREVRMVMDRDLGLVAVTGNLPSSDELAASRDIPRTLDANDAVDRAVRHVLGASAGLDALESHGGYQHFALRSSGAELGAARTKPVVATTARGLRPGHYVEVDERGAEGHEPRHVAVVIDAEDGTTLYTHDLIAAEAYSYRAFGAPDFGSAPWDSPLGSVATPHPTGMRDGFAPVASPPSLMTLESTPFSRSDPWLPPGATRLAGNNVWAFIDRAGPDGFQPGLDLEVSRTAPGVFDHVHDPLLAPTANDAQRQASAVHAFYVTNFLHDWFYDSGFDEAAGNAQAANHGRGGLDGDRLVVEVQDALRGAAARTSVPADGASPRIELGIYPGDRDLALDTTVVAHEWGHLLVRRLAGDANGLTNPQGHALDEGWADFIALLVSVRQEDVSVAANPNWSGVYAIGGYARGSDPDAHYFGLRRVPYSTDFTRNALTFRHITRGVALPTTHPVAEDAAGATNHHRHRSAEVWATMLWEAYTGLLQAHPFQEAQDRMKRYLVASLRATPIDPTFVEARDALLAVVSTYDPADHQRFINAFARRGLGIGAVAPPRDAADHVGVVESFHNGSRIAVSAVRLDDSRAPCDADGVLDVGETGLLRVTVTNTGFTNIPGSSVNVSVAGATATFPSGNSTWLPALARGASATVSLPVQLVAVSDDPVSDDPAHEIELTLSFSETSLPATDRTHVFVFPVHHDERLASASVDSVEAARSEWVATPSAGPRAFRIERDDAGHHWRGPGASSAGESTLTSPPIQVADSGALGIALRARWSFEDDDGYRDGWVIELSEDGGPFVDLAELGVTPGYSDVLEPGSPLAGRPAFVGMSEGFPAWSNLALDLGTRFAGKTVRIRFRVATDGALGAHGLELDELAVTGAATPPFSSRVAETSTGCNRAPRADAGPDLAVTEFDGDPALGVRRVVTLSGHNSADPEGALLTYEWVQLEGPPVTLSGASTVAPSFVAAVSADATLTFALTVSDGTDTDRDLVSVRIVDQTRPPVALVTGPTSVLERDDVTLDGTGSTDPEGGTLTYAWTQTAGPAVSFDATASTVTFAAPEVAADTVLGFSLVVSSGGTASAPVAWALLVQEQDRLPTVSAPATLDALPGELVQVTATGADPDGDPLTFAWTQTAGPELTLFGADSETVYFVAPDGPTPTTLTLEVAASAGGATSAPASVQIAVAARGAVDRAPMVSVVASTTVESGATGTVTATAVDPDGDAITFAWSERGGSRLTLTGATTDTVSFVAPTVTEPTLIELEVVATAGTASDAAVVVVLVYPSADETPEPMPAASSGCAVGSRSTSTPWALLVGLGALIAARRKRR